jgi:hypothetical protein
MKILSFDVGIKNLAYCIINKNVDNSFDICDWNIINLEDKKMLCCGKQKNKENCDSHATYFITLNDEIKYYCKTHVKNCQKQEIIIRELEKNNNNLCCYLVKNESCNKKSFSEINNKYYCKTHSKLQQKKLEKDNLPKLINRKTSGDMGVDDMASRLFKALDNLPQLLQVDEVMIENQPVLKNPKMKTQSTFLYSYFCIRGFIDKEKNNSTINKVCFFLASNKLKINKEKSDLILNKLKEDNKNEKKTKIDSIIYKNTKKLSEEYVKVLLKDYPDKLQFLNSNNKKDDLCDSFLQAFYLLYNKNLPDEYMKLLNKTSDLYLEKLNLNE